MMYFYEWVHSWRLGNGERCISVYLDMSCISISVEDLAL